MAKKLQVGFRRVRTQVLRMRVALRGRDPLGVSQGEIHESNLLVNRQAVVIQTHKFQRQSTRSDELNLQVVTNLRSQICKS